jgi:hypothetical protein
MHCCCFQVYSSTASWAPYDLLEQMLYHDPQPQQQQQQQHQQEGHLVGGPPAAVASGGSSPHTAAAGMQRSQQQQHQQLLRLPHVLIRAALHDAEVPVDNPVKVLARMRRLKSFSIEQQQQQQQQQEQSLLLLRVLPGGHLAFEQDTKESAFKLAFLLAAAGGAQGHSSG